MPPYNSRAVNDLKAQLKLARRHLGLISTVLNIDTEEMTVGAFTQLIEKIYHCPHLLAEVIEEYNL